MRVLLRGWLLSILFSGTLMAQTNNLREPGNPYSGSKSPMFGKDIVINDQPAQNQENLAVCTAFNGWLYAVYSYEGITQPRMSILRSEDNGITWNLLLDELVVYPGGSVNKFVIASAGNTISTHKIFLGMVYSNSSNITVALVARYNGEPFAVEELIFQPFDIIYDLTLATDNFYPAVNSDPFSVAVLYAKLYNPVSDSLTFQSSADGGISFNNHKPVASTPGKFADLQLSYGKSSSFNSGRYYTAWVEKETINSPLGHVFTAHTEPNISGSYTVPVCLDCLDPLSNNKCRRPAIATLCGNFDNDSSNITSVVVAEKYIPGSNTYDLKGFYNLQSASSQYFRQFTLSTSANNKLQPAVCFNPFDSTFVVTYFDSTSMRLPYLTQEMNFPNPGSWNIISSGYNDQSNISEPKPILGINQQEKVGFNSWYSDGENGNKLALFDSRNSTYTGVTENKQPNITTSIKVYPNPCDEKTKFSFILTTQSLVELGLYTVTGQETLRTTIHLYNAGSHTLNLNTLNIPSGIYMFSIRTGNDCSTGKLIILH